MSSQTIKVLLVEGDAAKRSRVLDACRSARITIESVDTVAEAGHRLVSRGIEAVLITTGHDRGASLRAAEGLHHVDPGMPLFVLAGSEQERRAIESLAQGVQAFSSLDELEPRWLIRSVRDGIHRPHAVSELASIPCLMAILDTLDAAVVLLDSSGTIRIGNQRWRHSPLARGLLLLDGLPQTNYLAACEGGSEENRESLVPVVRGVREVIDGAVPEFRLDYPFRTGAVEYWISLRAARFEQDGHTWVLLTHHDITSRQRTQHDLQQSTSAALEASRHNSELLTNITHEIRTPMNAIMGMTQLALESDPSPELNEYLDTIRVSADHLLSLINDVLDFSRIEANQLTMESIPFRLSNTVHETLMSMAFLAHSKGLELISYLSAEAPDALIGDPTRLRQVLINLVGNAIKFTEQGAVVVKTEVESQHESSVVLHFAVVDGGIGIAPEKQDLIFHAFTQADGSTARRYGGTGLGLAIASRLVERMNGRLWLESEEGVGSTFHFSGRFGCQPESRSKITLATPESLHGARVLIVDDNRESRQTLSRTLSEFEMAPLTLDSAHRAVVELRAAREKGKPFAVALVDVQMPEQDGFALAREVLRDPELSDVPLILMTRVGQRGDGARCRELGVAGYLSKPIATDELLRAIRAVLGQPGSDEEKPLVTRHSVEENRRQLRFLLAEDNEANQKLAIHLIKKRGHTVVAVRDGKEVLEQLASDSFDVILMDIDMPDLDGYETTARIREQEEAAGGHIPIVALTAHTRNEERGRCIQAGMDGYAEKPIRVAELFATIDDAIGELEE